MLPEKLKRPTLWNGGSTYEGAYLVLKAPTDHREFLVLDSLNSAKFLVTKQ
jgi:hypothetical protein